MIRLTDITLHQGSFSLESVNLDIPQGQYTVLMGPSGSGKTTIMEIVCGLRDIESGKIEVGEVDVTNLAPGLRRIGYVPQDGALFPTMKVGDQIAYPLSLKKLPAVQIDAKVKELAEHFDISHLLNRMPKFLSGGEKQRVALARALAMDPLVLCFDEPLSALDEELHSEVCDLLKREVAENNLTVLHITHSRSEAERFSENIYKIINGAVSRVTLTDKQEC
jgi:ABC-type sugar transport system ATPase subunit